jgi:integrase
MGTILAECPLCHRKQSVKSKQCKCGQDLDKAKKSKRVRYWLDYFMSGGKQRRESLSGYADIDPYSITDAKKALAKREIQKKEKRFFDTLSESTMTFQELTNWYLDLGKVKALASYKTSQVYLKKFNSEFGDRIVDQIKLADLENLQQKRKQQGLKPKTIDDEINYAKSAVIKAFNNDLVGGNTLRAFKRVEGMLKKNANARDRVLTKAEYEALLNHAPKHVRDKLIIGYWTGMRKGEIDPMTWDKVYLKERFIKLEPEDTKEDKAKNIPIGEKVYETLSQTVRHLHSDYVFLYNGKPTREFYSALRTACKKAGIIYGREVKDGFIFHDLRRTFKTDMRKAGVHKSVIDAITGHSSNDMDSRYNVVDDHDKLLAIKKLEEYHANFDHSVDQVTQGF